MEIRQKQLDVEILMGKWLEKWSSYVSQELLYNLWGQGTPDTYFCLKKYYWIELQKLYL